MILFAVAKFLSAWAMPLGVACFLTLAGMVLGRRRPWLGKTLRGLGLGLLWVLGTGAVADRVIGPLERAFPVPPETVRADAVVVLAGTVDLSRSRSERIEFSDRPERLIEGAKLVKRGRARWLVISGGSGDPLRPEAVEAELLGIFAQELGVRPEAIFVQGESRTTADDARYTAKLLRQRGYVRFFLVTSAFHMPRAVACFRKLGLEPIPYPVDFRATPYQTDIDSFTPTASALQASTLAIHEYVGYGVYWILGKI